MANLERTAEKKMEMAKKMGRKDELCEHCGSHGHKTHEHHRHGKHKHSKHAREEYGPQDKFSGKDEKKESAERSAKKRDKGDFEN